MSRTASLTRVGIAYATAIAAAVVWLAVGPDTGHAWLDGLLADVVATLVVFGFSRAHHNSSFYDAYWSVAPPLLGAYWWATGAPGLSTTRAVLAALVVLVWAVRLTGNWVYSFPGLHHEDWRYTLLRDRPGRPAAVNACVDLFAIHLIPTLQVFLGCLPLYVLTHHSTRGPNALDVVAVVVGLGAVALEGTADLQMHRFVAAKAAGNTPASVMDQGLWGRSRHPNYLGELGFWVSLALFGLAAAPHQWWVFAGSVAMLAMFLGASIPMMEQRSLERRPAYADVVARVPKLVPRPW